MAAYGAVTSLMITIPSILESSRISLVPPSREVLQRTYLVMFSLHQVLVKLDETGYSKIRTKVNALDDLIKQVVWEFEDLLESHLYDQILPQVESSRDHLSFSVDLQHMQQSVDCLSHKLSALEIAYSYELMNMPEEEGEPLPSRIDFRGINSSMVGLSQVFEVIKICLLQEDSWNCFTVTGMAGVGKTTLAKKVFDDPSIHAHFELRAWVKVGRKCESNKALGCILAQLDPNTRDHMLTHGEDEQKLVEILEEFEG